MRIKVNPNRMQLLRLRRQLALAERGHKLLKDKQEELTRQFLILVRKVRNERADVETELAEVYRAFIAARGEIPWTFMAAALLNPRKAASLQATEISVMGVRSPEFELILEDRPFSLDFTETTGDLDAALSRLEKLLPRLVVLGQMENSIFLMADDLERTRRRVNALEHVLIPSLEETIRSISAKLSENERSTITRLMKIKDMVRER